MRRIQEIKEAYKLEILEDISRKHPDAPITIYHIGEPGSRQHWWDLCAGPHVETTGDINPAAVDLENVAGVPLATHPAPGALCECRQRLLGCGQADAWVLHARRILAGRRKEGATPAHLRHSLGEQGAAAGLQGLQGRGRQEVRQELS